MVRLPPRSNPGSRNFEYLTGETSPTLRVEMTAESEGAEYRCFITDAHGDMGSTRIATVKLDTRDWQMEYNTSGIRTKRTSDDKTYSYIYAGDKLMRMTVGDDILDFSYDANGAPLTMTCNGTVYYYITNLQGDVMAVESATGSTVAQYAYDAWGNIIAMMGTLAELNPLRYRGHVYDQETGFYYVSSRYYDPEIGRFINADNQIVGVGGEVLGYNMFYISEDEAKSLASQLGQSLPSSEKTIRNKLLKQLIAGHNFRTLDRKLRCELIALDGACIIDARQGTIYSFGAIIQNDSGSATGGRSAAAKKLSRYGIAIKISTDGYIDVFVNEELVYSVK